MPFNNPFALQRVLDTLDLPGLSPDNAVDVGCGTGELLLALANRGWTGFGVDTDPASIAQATAAGAGLPVTFRCADAADVALPSSPLITCLGATHAYGRGPAALTGALTAFRTALPPGGHVLIGEGFHRRPLPAPYAALLGTPSGIERTHSENIAACETAGFTCIHSLTASQAEWDVFEESHYRRGLEAAAALPAADRAAREARLDRWRDGYLRWGREVMGFGGYLLRVG